MASYQGCWRSVTQVFRSSGWYFYFHYKKGVLGGGNSSMFYFYPYLGKIPILTNILQRGWNHQLEKVLEDLESQKTEARKKAGKLICLNSLWIIQIPCSIGITFSALHIFFNRKDVRFIFSSVFHNFHYHVSFPFLGGQETLKLMFLNTCCFNRYFWFWDQVVGSI